MPKVDPITLEVVQNRLLQTAHEGGYALIRTGASPGIVHTKDLGFNVCDPAGRPVSYSLWMPRHGTTLAYMLRATRRRFPDSDIQAGDMFLTNNPHDGALHNLDLAVLAPCYYKGQLIAWTACATHHLDIGAVTPGRAPNATDWRQEGLIFPPMKIVERGRLREDFFEFFLTNVRAPQYQGLDLKGQIAANNVAQDRLRQLADRYGVDTLLACYDEMMDLSETKTRERIRRLRPGRYHATQYLNYDKMYKLECTLIVEDGTLTFDFTGTDPQSRFFVNEAEACTVANVHNLFICLLVPDLAINEGCFRPLRFVLPPGTVFSCLPPAPCGAASTTSSHRTASLVLEVLSKALLQSDEWWRANAAWGTGMTDILLSGNDRKGQPVFARMQIFARGGGARANKDGVDAGGVVHSTSMSIANVETLERRFPVLYLFNRYRVDSGGAGKYRGGMSTEAAYKLHGADKLDANVWYVDKDVPNEGLEGGLPGVGPTVYLKRNTNVNELLARAAPDYSDIQGEEVLLPCQTPVFPMTERDVLLDQIPAGGGFGDPLERDPEAVLRDVVEGYVSVEAAREKYKVIMLPGYTGVDLEATQRLRQQAHRRT